MSVDDVLNTNTLLQRKITLFNINDIKSQCIKHIPEWNDHTLDDLQVCRFSHGIMNYVFKVTSKKSQLKNAIFRVFDFDPKSNVDRHKEDIAFETAGNLGLGPKIYSRFKDIAKNGCRIEEYIEHETLTQQGFLNHNLVEQFAKSIALFHLKMTQALPNWDKSNALELCLNDWYNEAISYDDHVNLFDPNEIKLEILNYIKELNRRVEMGNCAYNVVFSHNDVLQYNILCRKDRITLVDLELVNYNFAGYDIASFIGASHIRFGIKEFPFITTEHDMIYPKETIKHLLINYLEASNINYNDELIESTIGEIRFLELGWWLNRILFIGLTSLRDEDKTRKEIMAEFSRTIRKTYYYKKEYGISNNFFNPQINF